MNQQTVTVTRKEAVQIDAEINRFMDRLQEMGVRDAVILFCVNYGETMVADRSGFGSPWGQDGLMRHFLNGNVAEQIGSEVATQMPKTEEGDDLL